MKLRLLPWIPLALAITACAGPAHHAEQPSFNPGEDFYLYVNHDWLDANPVPPAYGSWGVFHEINERSKAILHEILVDAAANPNSQDALTQQLGRIWAAGMDTDAIEAAGVNSIRPYLDQIGQVDSHQALAQVVAQLHLVNVDVLFGLGAEADFEDSSQNITFIAPGGLGLPEKDYYFREDEESETLRKQYVQHIANMLELAGDSAEQAQAAAQRIFEMETAMATETLGAVEYRDPQVLANKIPSNELSKEIMPGFAWELYFEALGLDPQPVVNLVGPKYFRHLNGLLAQFSLADWRDYFRWHLITRSAPFLSSNFAEEDFDFFQRKLSGTQTNKERWERVLRSVNRSMGDALGKAFVARTFSPEAKVTAQQMVADLLAAFRGRIQELAWMTEETKAKALEKLDAFTVKIGYPDKWRDYSQLQLTGDSWVEMLFQAAIFNNRFDLAKIGKPVDKTEWDMSPQTVNAYYNPLANAIVFPAAILQPPFFGLEQSLAENYGSMGAIIGHEITHGFDDMGSQFDADGNLTNWWTDADREEFERRAQVLVEQFNAYVAIDDLHVNGKLTLGENIADLGGLQMAYRAFQIRAAETPQPVVDGLTPEQQFFIAWARSWRANFRPEKLKLQVNTDPHSPDHFRANGPLGNLPVFAEAFHLGENAPMVRPASQRADIW